MEIRDFLIGFLIILYLELFMMLRYQHQVNSSQIKVNQLTLDWLKALRDNIADLYAQLGKVQKSNGK